MNLFAQALLVAVLAVAAAVVTPWLTALGDPAVAVAVIAIPMVVLLFLLWRRIDRGEGLLLGKRFAVFLLAYCTLLAILPGIQALQWKNRLVGYDQVLPTNWLGLDRFGDWRYWLMPRPRDADDMLIVQVPARNPAGQLWPRAELRLRFAALIRQAASVGAKGVVLDYYFAKETPSDGILCASVQAAQERNFPVIVGFGHTEQDRLLVRSALPQSLSSCLPDARQGYLAGYVETDKRMRRVPLYFLRDHNRPSLSLLAARVLTDQELRLPNSELLQYLEPQQRIVSVTDFFRGHDINRYRDRLIFVGPASENDSIETPFGTRQGVEIHAAAAHALRTGTFVQHAGIWLTLPTIYALCYLLVWLQVRTGGIRGLIQNASWISLGVVGLAVLSAKMAVWVEVAYPLGAIWLLVALFLLHGRFFKFKALARAKVHAAQPDSTRDFDVFLCHNSIDKDSVRELYNALLQRGLRPWFDETELPPGHEWQEGLERGLSQSRSVAVIVGPSGIGPWAQQEMRAALMLSAQSKAPVIPVLLPGVTQKPELPLFLLLRTWVDCRKGLTEQALARLEWGITGVPIAKKVSSSVK